MGCQNRKEGNQVMRRTMGSKARHRQ
jgi:hypothetical protein